MSESAQPNNVDGPHGNDGVAQAGEAAHGPGGIDRPTEQLFDAVHEAGDRLLNDRTYSSAHAYRSAVQQLLRKILPEANSVQIYESGHGIMSRKRYFLLTSINRSVDRLLAGLMSTQGEQMDILGRLEEIHGMLVDLVQ